ncbi:ribonuclease H-like domain-containing protein, partial [Tanacetum coccineum]
NELAWGEKYEFQNYELKCREIKINNLNLELEKVVKERDELKDKKESSKNLDEILNSQMSARDKTGLGYSTQLNELSSNHETNSENSLSIFDARSSDEENTPKNDRFSKNVYKAVSPPITGNFLTPRADISFAGELVVSNLKINRDSVIIEDWNSDDEEEVYEVKIVRPETQTVRPETQTVKTRDDKSGQTSQKQGIGFKKVKACFVCKSTNHLIKDCQDGFDKAVISKGHVKESLEERIKSGCDNGTEFKNYAMNELCAKKGIKREFSVARTPQQNGVAERKNRTLIKAARTMLADSLLPIPFWAEAVNTACYVLNRVLVTKPQNKTPYELLIGKSPSISFMRPFGCPLTILNTLDSLGKFDGKSDEGYLLGYSTSSKAFRVYNKRTKRVEENLHINFLKDQPNVAGTGPNWMFDLDFLTNSINYVPISVENKVNTPYVSAASTPTGANAGESSFVYLGGKIPIDASTLPNADLPIYPNMPDLEDASDTLPNDGIFNGAYDDEINRDPTLSSSNKRKIQEAFFSSTRPEPKTISQPYKNEELGGTMQEELLQFKNYRRLEDNVVQSLKNDAQKFQMSSMGELTFFLGLQVKQQPDGIFISQDKFMIGSLMYLTASSQTSMTFSPKDLMSPGDFVPLLPAMLAGAAMDQGDGSAQPAEPHHTPVDPLPSTSLPPIPSPPLQSPPHSPLQSPPYSPPHYSPPRSYEAPLPEGNTSGSAEASIQLKELMVLVPNLVTRVTSLEKELKETKQTLGNDVLKLYLWLVESMKEKSTDFVTPTKASGEAQEEESGPTILEAAKTLSNCFSKYNSGIKDVNIGSSKVDTDRTSISTSSIIHSPKKGQKEGKSQMVEEDIQATHKTKEQIRQEEAGFEEAIRLQAQMNEEVAKQIHLDKMLAKRVQEEQELLEQQLKRKAEVQKAAQFYTKEDWDTIRAKLEANTEVVKSLQGESISNDDFAKRMVEMIDICTDIAKISRKRLKPDNHGHGNGIECAKARENAIKGLQKSKVNQSQPTK